jgi:hypothetical protein
LIGPVELAAGEHWYSSLTFWTIAGPVVAVLSTLAIVWVTIRVASPKRRLMCAMPVITPLLNSAAGVTGTIEVRRDGQLLTNPRVVELKLASRGRNDIPRSAFDGHRPIRLDIGTPIVQCLSVTTQPDDRTMPEPTIDGTALLIQPTLIGKHQTTVYSLLIDGSEPSLSKPEQTLTDVDIQKRDPDDSTGTRQLIGALALAVLVAVLGLLVWKGGTPSTTGEAGAAAVAQVKAGAAVLAVLAAAVAAMLAAAVAVRSRR